MPTTISSNDAKQGWGSLLSDVSERGEEVVVESHGKPKAAVVSIAAYEELKGFREQRRRADALARLHRLHERIAARNANATESEEEANEFAVKLGRESNAATAARWRADYEDQRR